MFFRLAQPLPDDLQHYHENYTEMMEQNAETFCFPILLQFKEEANKDFEGAFDGSLARRDFISNKVPGKAVDTLASIIDGALKVFSRDRQ